MFCAVLFNCSYACGQGTWTLCVWVLLLRLLLLLPCSNAIFMLSAFACCKLNAQEAAADDVATVAATNVFIYATRRRFTWNAATCAQPASQPAIEAAKQHHINITYTPHIFARFAKVLTWFTHSNAKDPKTTKPMSKCLHLHSACDWLRLRHWLCHFGWVAARVGVALGQMAWREKAKQFVECKSGNKPTRLDLTFKLSMPKACELVIS